jgi:outer membrane protein assembly factor BamE (lipoprotein component of BamABCDE complex)
MFYAIIVFVITVGVIFGAIVIVVVWSGLDCFPDQKPPGEVTFRMAKRIQSGMTKNEVLTILGNPQCRRDAKGRNEEWEYEIKEDDPQPPSTRLRVCFDDEDGRTARVLFNNDKKQ